MPRLRDITLSALDDLASQLRYAPSSQVIAWVGRAIDLAGTIESDRLYPEDWLAHRLTGYRPDAVAPALLVGGAIRRDLSAFVERVTDRAELTPDAAGPSLTLDALVARWGVSRKTIERSRGAGLIAVRVRDGGRTRLAFPIAAVETYERTRSEVVGRGRGRTRIDAERRRRIIEIAERARRRFGWSLNEVAQRIARREDRAHETIRQVLLNAGAPRDSIGRDDRRRRVIARATRGGVPEARLAERYGKSTQTIRRIMLEERAAAANRFAHMIPTLTAPDERWLEHPAVRTDLGPEIETTSGDWFRIARSTAPPDAAAEAAIARAVVTLLHRARSATEPDTRPTLASVDRAATDLRWASLLTEKLIASQRGIILAAIEGRLGRSVLSLASADARSAHRAAMDAAIDAAWRFISRDHGVRRRLAGVVGPAVDRATAAWARDHTPPGGPARVKNIGASLDDWSQRASPWTVALAPPTRLLHADSDHHPLMIAALHARHGMTGRPPRTITEIAEDLGVPATRVRRLIPY